MIIRKNFIEAGTDGKTICLNFGGDNTAIISIEDGKKLIDSLNFIITNVIKK